MPSLAVSVGAWLTRVTKSEKPPADIEAYNIGIFESDGGFQLYLVGAKAYDPLNSDWACDEDFVPREKYFKLVSEKKLKTWKDAEIAVRSGVEKFLAGPHGRTSFLKRAVAVTVGFDEGELTVVHRNVDAKPKLSPSRRKLARESKALSSSKAMAAAREKLRLAFKAVLSSAKTKNSTSSRRSGKN